jgi:hypothetical protein
MVMENGVVQTPITDYTLTGTTLTFVVAPTSGTKVQIREMAYGSDDATAASSYANSAYIQANTAATNAISAGVYANAAFAKANTGSSSSTNNARTMINAYVFGS